MAKKKITTNTDLITYYMKYCLEHNETPKSVYIFAKKYSFEEQLFYKYFGSFNSLDQTIFKTFFENTLSLLEKDKKYPSYGARYQLLSFYYSFFELLTANRSFVAYALDEDKHNLKKIKTLQLLKQSFIAYVDSLDLTLIETKQDSLENIQRNTIKETAWIQLVLTIKYWLDDTSPSFEKTDVFIEKTINTSFDLLNIKPLNSIIDFGKFLYKDKTFMN